MVGSRPCIRRCTAASSRAAISRRTWRRSRRWTSRRSIWWRSTSIRSRPRSPKGAGYEATVEMIDVGGPGDDPRRRQEPRERDGRGRSRGLRAGPRKHARARRPDHGGAAAAARGQGVRPDRRLRCGDRAVVRGADRRAPAGAAHDHGQARSAVALRREPAPAGRVLRDRRAGARASPRRPRSRARRSSFNNLADADAAFELVCELEQPAVAIIKHANPCGVAVGDDLAAGLRARRSACDPTSAYGGIVALNRPLDRAAAEQIAAVFTEVVIAPDADAAARAVLAAKPNLRLLLTGGLARSRPGELLPALGRGRASGPGAGRRGSSTRRSSRS